MIKKKIQFIPIDTHIAAFRERILECPTVAGRQHLLILTVVVGDFDVESWYQNISNKNSVARLNDWSRDWARCWH